VADDLNRGGEPCPSTPSPDPPLPPRLETGVNVVGD